MKTSYLLSVSAGLLFVCACNKKELGSDTTAPTMQLVGPDSVYVLKGEMGTDPGATATDNFDGDISAQVTSDWDSIAKLNRLGKNNVTYRVSDKANNVATIERLVYIDFTGKMPLGVYATSISNNFTTCVGPSYGTGNSTVSATPIKDQFTVAIRDVFFIGYYAEFTLTPVTNDLTKMNVKSVPVGNRGIPTGFGSFDAVNSKLNVFYSFENRSSSINCTYTYSLQLHNVKQL